MNEKTTHTNILKTKKYTMFLPDPGNRPVTLDGPRRKALRKSMQKYGFLAAYPIVCKPEGGKLVVVDGQARLAVAKELGIPVWYIVVDTDQQIDTAALDGTHAPWTIEDYARRWAAAWKQDYAELLQFCKDNNMAISVAMGILSSQGEHSTSDNHHSIKMFRAGEFTITSREIADRVARLYKSFTSGSWVRRQLRNRFFVGALYAIAHVPYLDETRLLRVGDRNNGPLEPYGSSERYVRMLGYLYNYGQRTRHPLKEDAEDAMRAKRNEGRRARAGRKHPGGQR
jgi:hypothetical protein